MGIFIYVITNSNTPLLFLTHVRGAQPFEPKH